MNASNKTKMHKAVRASDLLACGECGTQPQVELDEETGDTTVDCPKCLSEVVTGKTAYAIIQCWNFQQERKHSNPKA